MAFDEKRIIEIILSKFKERLSRIKTKNDLEIFLNDLTKSKIKIFIKKALEDEAIKRDQFSGDEIATANNIRSIKNYIESL